MKKFIKAIPGFSIFAPYLAFAQLGEDVGPGQDATGIIELVQALLNIVMPLIVAIGTVYFFWGVIRYVTAKDEESKKEARGVMISGIVALFIILALWGIIGIVARTLGIGLGGDVQPFVPEATNRI